MFHSSALSLPKPFSQEHQPLRLTSDLSRPQPTGQCHFQLLHPAAHNQICPCQIYQHNRSAPGNICDCGHSACYHGATVTVEKTKTAEHVPDIETGEKIKKLEDMILAEREIRASLLARERQAWETEVRILREALAPFYTSEQHMQERLLQLEDKMGNPLDAKLHIRERLLVIDDTSSGSETRFDIGSSKSAHRSSLNSDDTNASHNSIQTSDDVPGLTSSDERSITSSLSRHQTPSEIMALSSIIEPESPRSSGILDLVNFPRPMVPSYNIPRRASKTISVEEPRSSGFLGVDLREHLKNRAANKRASQTGSQPPSVPTNPQPPTPSFPAPWSTTSSSSSRNHTTHRFLPRPSPPTNGCGFSTNSGYVSSDQTFWEARNAKRRKHQNTENILALDVLANVSAASTLISS